MAKKVAKMSFISCKAVPTIACFALSFMHYMPLAAQTSPRSDLVVGITVEGLSLDYLELLRDRFSTTGLGYILDNAVTITDVDFGTTIDGTTANAIIYTGASPNINGVGSREIYDIATRRVVPLLNSQSPSAADENYSPSAIMTTTLTDELKLDSDGAALVHSVAPEASMAITAAGHTANSSYWINDASGRWTTSTYYQDRPVFLQYRNRMTPLQVKLDTLSWTPKDNIDKFPVISKLQQEYPFRILFPHNDPQRYKKYKSSPIVNNEVNEVAIDFIKNLDLGKHEAIDMLSVAYTLQPYPYGHGKDERPQILDSYFRFDKNISDLLAAIDGSCGLNNAIIFIVGTPALNGSRKEDEKWRIPSGDFSVRKATSLLNLYLINKFGNGDWIAGFHNGYFYINPTIASDNNADIKNVRAEASSFLKRMAGVAYSYTIDEVLDRQIHDNPDAWARNTRADSTGDILVTLSPGWRIVENNGQPDDDLTMRIGAATAPAFILAPGIKQQTVKDRTDARAIAPTVASLLRIRSPNGASLPPLRFNK